MVYTLLYPRPAATSEEQREILKKAGFIHVTGLTLHGPVPGQRRTIGRPIPAVEGSFGTKNGYTVLVTLGGEVWLAKSHTIPPGLGHVLKELCPAGNSYQYVPLSEEGEWIHHSELMERFSKPDWNLPFTR